MQQLLRFSSDLSIQWLSISYLQLLSLELGKYFWQVTQMTLFSASSIKQELQLNVLEFTVFSKQQQIGNLNCFYRRKPFSPQRNSQFRTKNFPLQESKSQQHNHPSVSAFIFSFNRNFTQTFSNIGGYTISVN